MIIPAARLERLSFKANPIPIPKVPKSAAKLLPFIPNIKRQIVIRKRCIPIFKIDLMKLFKD